MLIGHAINRSRVAVKPECWRSRVLQMGVPVMKWAWCDWFKSKPNCKFQFTSLLQNLLNRIPPFLSCFKFYLHKAVVYVETSLFSLHPKTKKKFNDFKPILLCLSITIISIYKYRKIKIASLVSNYNVIVNSISFLYNKHYFWFLSYF